MMNRATPHEAARQCALAKFLHTNTTPAPKWHADTQLADRAKSISTCSISATIDEKTRFSDCQQSRPCRRYRGPNKSGANYIFGERVNWDGYSDRIVRRALNRCRLSPKPIASVPRPGHAAPGRYAAQGCRGRCAI